MIWYIDFDGTMYNTGRLKSAMAGAVAKVCTTAHPELLYNEMYDTIYNHFSSHAYNVVQLCRYVSDTYNVPYNQLKQTIVDILGKGTEYVYPDVIPALLALRKAGHQLHILTYVSPDCEEYQYVKLMGSGLVKYFDEVHVVTCDKWLADVDYAHGTFVDDHPKVLRGLLSRQPHRVIRMRRPDNSYSVEDMDIETYASMQDIQW